MVVFEAEELRAVADPERAVPVDSLLVFRAVAEEDEEEAVFAFCNAAARALDKILEA